MFLRPTESPIVFLQQLGRGFRTCKGKEYLNVLDFIGNYEKAGRAPLLLSGGNSFGAGNIENGKDIAKGIAKGVDYFAMEYPDDCIVDFDLWLIDLFRELDKKSLSVKERIRQEYFRIKELLGEKVPTRMGVYGFLHEMAELSAKEEDIYKGIGREFLFLIETTDMQKVYKMPVLYSFYNHGNVRMAVTDEELLESWKEFFNTGTNWKDFAADLSYSEYKAMTDEQQEWTV